MARAAGEDAAAESQRRCSQKQLNVAECNLKGKHSTFHMSKLDKIFIVLLTRHAAALLVSFHATVAGFISKAVTMISRLISRSAGTIRDFCPWIPQLFDSVPPEFSETRLR